MLRRITILSALAMGLCGAAPLREAAPTIEATGPLRTGRYVKPFAQNQPSRQATDFAARYTYGTPLNYYGGYYYGCGGYYFHPIYYCNGPYYPCY